MADLGAQIVDLFSQLRPTLCVGPKGLLEGLKRLVIPGDRCLKVGDLSSEVIARVQRLIERLSRGLHGPHIIGLIQAPRSLEGPSIA